MLLVFELCGDADCSDSLSASQLHMAALKRPITLDDTNRGSDIFSDVVISEGTFTDGGVLTSNSAALKATQYKLHYSHFPFLHEHFIRKT